MDTAATGGRAFASLPQNGEGDSVVNASSLAIFRATRIRPEDQNADPINYSVGIWGKLIIIGSVKRQAIIMSLNPDVEYDRLDWELIRRDVHDRTIERIRNLMTVENIKIFFANRMTLYKKWFPNFFQFECAVDQLIRHYSLRLLEVREKHGDVANPNSTLYWDNNETVEESLAQGGNTDLLMMGTTQTTTGSVHMNDDQSPSPMEEEEQKGIVTEFEGESQALNTEDGSVNTTEIMSTLASILVEANSDPGMPTTPMASVPFTDRSLSSTPNVAPNPPSSLPTTEVRVATNTPSTSTPAYVCDRNENDLPFTVKCSGVSSVVIEHSIHNSQAPVTVARSPPSYQTRRSFRKYVDESKQSVNSSIRNSKVDPLPNLAAKKEENKAFLMLLHQRFSQGCIQDMSEILARKATVEGKGFLLPYTLGDMERKIKSGEIVDVKSFLGHCRCIAAMYLLHGPNNEIPTKIAAVLQSMNNARLHDLPDAICKSLSECFEGSLDSSMHP